LLRGASVTPVKLPDGEHRRVIEPAALTGNYFQVFEVVNDLKILLNFIDRFAELLDSVVR
jgi:hypothetical protein